MKNLMYILIAALLLSSCDYFMPKQSHDKLLAKVDDKELRLSDVQEIFPNGISHKDSVELLKSYINNWARKCVMAAEAEKHLDNNRKDISQELNDYKMSLLAYRYEMQYVEKRLNTSVTEQDLQDYHKQNAENDETPYTAEQLKERYYTTIINKRRLELINKVENEAYNEAIDNKRLKIYINE